MAPYDAALLLESPADRQAAWHAFGNGAIEIRIVQRLKERDQVLARVDSGFPTCSAMAREVVGDELA